MLYRVLAAVALAISLAAIPAYAQSGSAKAHIAAAKKAERAKNFKKMLNEYTAACSQEPTGECQLGIADALAKMGQADKARAGYQALINDPFAQDKWTTKAKKSLAKLDSAPPPSLDLPAGPPSLDAPPALEQSLGGKTHAVFGYHPKNHELRMASLTSSSIVITRWCEGDSENTQTVVNSSDTRPDSSRRPPCGIRDDGLARRRIRAPRPARCKAGQ